MRCVRRATYGRFSHTGKRLWSWKRRNEIQIENRKNRRPLKDVKRCKRAAFSFGEKVSVGSTWASPVSCLPILPFEVGTYYKRRAGPALLFVSPTYEKGCPSFPSVGKLGTTDLNGYTSRGLPNAFYFSFTTPRTDSLSPRIPCPACHSCAILRPAQRKLFRLLPNPPSHFSKGDRPCPTSNSYPLRMQPSLL
jgi:hypothetical protein